MNNALPYAVRVEIDEAMRTRAAEDAKLRQMQRTQASPDQSYIGTLGELVWAKLRYGDWRAFDTLNTKGQADDAGDAASPWGSVEVKTSKTRLSLQSHLMVREDYAHKRQPVPAFYVLVLLAQDQKPHQESEAYVCGWATHAEVLAEPPRERISQHTQAKQGYRCYEVACRDLHPLIELPFALAGMSQN